MIYLLQYAPAEGLYERDPISLPWVASDWMTKDSIIEDFQTRFPGNRVVSLEPAEVTA